MAQKTAPKKRGAKKATLEKNQQQKVPWGRGSFREAGKRAKRQSQQEEKSVPQKCQVRRGEMRGTKKEDQKTKRELK